MEAAASTPAIRVLCVDDHPLVRKGIAALLANEPDMRLVAEAGGGLEAIAQFKLHVPDVTLMDLRMPDPDGIATVKMIRSQFPEARFIALTSFGGDHHIHRALEAGVSGYLLKEMAHTDILRAIRLVHAGKTLMPVENIERLTDRPPQAALTPCEVEVLSLLSEGFANKEIGTRLGTASGIVKIHIHNIVAKLGAIDRTQAVTIGLQRGIIRS